MLGFVLFLLFCMFLLGQYAGKSKGQRKDGK